MTRNSDFGNASQGWGLTGTRLSGEQTHFENSFHPETADRDEALQRLADAIPEVLWVVALDPERVLYVSPSFERMWGFAVEALYREPRLWTETIHPEDRARVTERFSRWIAGEDVNYHDVEFRIIRPGGEIRWIHDRGVLFRDEQGRPCEVSGVSTDITVRKEAERALASAYQEIQTLKRQLQDENIALREEVARASMFEEIVGTSPALHLVLCDIAKVAPTDATVLITGETGTGKELVARAIHKHSARAGRPFVSVNCAAIPPALIASELFGHERGAFTGAVGRRTGRFELAAGGTLFLDEVGELPAETQVTLLRVLQEREFERVGGDRTIRADVRVIAATNRDLATAVAEKTFRADLFYRLNVFPIEVPALRERREDVPLLVEYFTHRYGTRAGKRISRIPKATLEALQAYDWPGNIRELQNVVERAVIISDEAALRVDLRWLPGAGRLPEALSPPVSDGHTLLDGSAAGATGLARLDPEHERALIEAALEQAKGRVAGPFGAAEKLGIPASTLESKIKALDIDKRRFKSVPPSGTHEVLSRGFRERREGFTISDPSAN
jgi:formate hydrogenlyase transcriptional activator